MVEQLSGRHTHKAAMDSDWTAAEWSPLHGWHRHPVRDGVALAVDGHSHLVSRQLQGRTSTETDAIVSPLVRP